MLLPCSAPTHSSTLIFFTLTAILLLSAGRRVELLQSIISAAHDLLPADFRVLAADATPELSAACSFADDSFVLPELTILIICLVFDFCSAEYLSSYSYD